MINKHPLENKTLKTIDVPNNLEKYLVLHHDIFLKQLRIDNPLNLKSNKYKKEDYYVSGEFIVSEEKVLICLKARKHLLLIQK